MNIKKYFHQKKSRAPVFSSEHVSWLERLGEDAYVGWVMIVSMSFLTAVVLIACAGQLFLEIESGGITAPQLASSSPNHVGLDQDFLDSIIASFDSKASTTAALEQGYTGPGDPSQ